MFSPNRSSRRRRRWELKLGRRVHGHLSCAHARFHLKNTPPTRRCDSRQSYLTYFVWRPISNYTLYTGTDYVVLVQLKVFRRKPWKRLLRREEFQKLHLFLEDSLSDTLAQSER